MFINRYKQPNIIQNYENFLKIINKLDLYFIKFNKNEKMKTKKYFFYYAIKLKLLANNYNHKN